MKSMRLLALTACVAVLPMTWAYATPLAEQKQGQAQGQAQGQLQGQAQGQRQSTKASSRSSAHSNSGAYSSANQAAGANAGATSGGNDLSADETESFDGGWGFTYMDAEAALPMAAIGSDVAVTSYRVKIGPLFGYSDQEVHYLPAAVMQTAGILLRTQGYDPQQVDPTSEGAQWAYSQAVCATMPDLRQALATSRFPCQD